MIPGTFKIVKTDLRKEAFNLNIVKDKLYFKDPAKGFVPITHQLYEDLMNGAVKV